MKVVEARGLKKKFGDLKALEDISFDVFQGECFGILGPYGAGKSTLIRALFGATRLEGGELFINGLNINHSLQELKSKLGVVPAQDSLENEFTVRQNLKVFGFYCGLTTEAIIQRTEYLLKSMGLEAYADQTPDVLQSGIKRRISIARALIHSPSLLVLDEPTKEMNFKSRQWLWNYLGELKSEGISVMLTTHYMEEAEKICDRIAIMDKGKILAVGEPHFLIRDHIGSQVIEMQVQKSELQYYISRLNSHKFKFQTIRDQVNVHLQSASQSQEVLTLVQSSKVTIRQPTLADVFLKLAGHDLREEPL